MVELLLVVGIAVAVFVGFNIGGSSTGVAFGPAVGSNVTGKVAAAALMSTFALLGGATVGRNVIDKMSSQIISISFTIEASVIVLFFIGLALLISNLFGVPASTSMTAVGSIAGLGAATGTIQWGVLGEIVVWWLVAPIMAFWTCAVIGRYVYPYLAARFAIDRSDDPMFAWRALGPVRVPVGLSASATYGELVSSALVVGIGCFMAFSAGASNVANAVAPLVGSGRIGTNPAILVGGGAIALGAFTIARRTLDTVGNDLTDLPLLAALIVEIVSASLITFLSYLGIPASLAVSATMCIVGLGWGRATRTVRISDAASAAVRGEGAGTDEDATPGASPSPGVGALAADEEASEVPRIGEEDPQALSAGDLFDPGTVARVVVLWIMTPSVAAVASYLVFEFGPPLA